MPTPKDYGFKLEDVIGLTQDDFERLFKVEPEKYPEHLRIALSLEQWADSIEANPASILDSADPKHNEGWVMALREVPAVLRQGQFLPGGQFRGLTDAEFKKADRAEDAAIKSAFEKDFEG